MARALLIAAMACLVPAPGLAAPPPGDQVAREAAIGRLKPPGGVGGCIFSAVPADVRREATISLLARKAGSSATLQSAIAGVAEACAGRPYSPADLALVGSVTSAFRKSAAALFLAHRFGVEQEALETAWRAAPAEEKAPFYRVAEWFLAPGRAVPGEILDALGFARRAGLDVATTDAAESFLRMYFINVAVSERAEASLAGERPSP